MRQIQMLSIQSFDTGCPSRQHSGSGGRGVIGRPHFLSGSMMTPPSSLRVGPTPALVGASRAVCGSTVRVLVVEPRQVEPAPGCWLEPSLVAIGSDAPELPCARALAEKLVRWAAHAGGRILGSFACSMPRLVCVLAADTPVVRHADEWRFCRKALPLGFSFLAPAATDAARAAIAALMEDPQHPFLPVASDADGLAGLPVQALSSMLQGPNQVLLSVAGLFEDLDSLPEGAPLARAGLRKMLRAEPL
jgi:hypothetical protein